jgi:hypothetical protein
VTQTELFTFEMAQRALALTAVLVIGRWVWETREATKRVIATLYGDEADERSGLVRRVNRIEGRVFNGHHHDE